MLVNTAKGTAWKSRSIDKEFSISGKTGTSQVRIISTKERETGIIKNKDLPFNKRDHALFIGFAPFKKPKYITAVVLGTCWRRFCQRSAYRQRFINCIQKSY